MKRKRKEIDENGVYGKWTQFAVTPLFVSRWVGVNAVKHQVKGFGEKKSTKTGFVASSGGGSPYNLSDYRL